MINGNKVLAVIPARAGSKGLPNKNILPLADKPLIYWSIKAALSCQVIDTVVVSTDSERIATISRSAGAEVPFLRPPELATDTASSIDVILHCVEHYNAIGKRFELVVLLEPTSPLREVSDIVQAIKLITQESRAKAVVSVCRVEATHPSFLYSLGKDNQLFPLTAKYGSHLRRQELSPIHYPDGSIYITYTKSLQEKRTFYHSETFAFEVPRWKAIEVDELHDLICADALLRYKKNVIKHE